MRQMIPLGDSLGLGTLAPPRRAQQDYRSLQSRHVSSKIPISRNGGHAAFPSSRTLHNSASLIGPRSAARCPSPLRQRSREKCRQNKSSLSDLPERTATCGCQTTCPQEEDAASEYRPSATRGANKRPQGTHRRQTSNV